MSAATLRVLYLLGYGRSGTTVLGNVLGEAPGFFHAGEVQRIWSRLAPGNHGRCGCGAQVRSCDVWRSVLGHVEAFVGDASHGLRGCVPGADPHEILRWQVRVTGRDRMRILLQDGARPSTLSRDAARYRCTVAALYRAIAATTGAGVIVDSSKIPQIGALLEGLPGISVSYLQVVRDPRGVVFSRQRRRAVANGSGRARMNRASVVADAFRWVRDNALAARVRRRVGPGRSMLLRYEDLVADPQGALRSVLRLVGVDAEPPLLDGGAARIRTNHTVCGNRNRFVTGEISFREDVGWRDMLGNVDSGLITAVTSPLLRRFGYPVSARPQRALTV